MKSNHLIFRLVGLIISIYLFINSFNISAQTPGVILEGDLTITGGLYPNGTPLDPNGDGYTSKPPSETPSQYTSVGFPANVNETDVNDILYSEIAYVGIPEAIPEPTADLSKGPDCGFTDLVQDANSRSTYYNTDGVNMRFRFRLGDAKPNSKGYSILIDTDGLIGFTGPNADPNATSGNPGFEVEIVLRTNFTVDANYIDGTGGAGTPIASLPYTTHAIKSLALTTVCGNPDYFYDFYIPFADLTSMGTTYIDSTTEMRMLAITSIAPKEAIGQNTTSDMAGADDSSGDKDSLFEEIIIKQTPTNGDPIERADCPLITGGATTPSVVLGDTQVQGTSTEENGTIIQVYINGVAHGSTTTVTGGAWTQTGIPALSTDDIITATATVPDTVASGIEKGTSEDNCDTTIVLASACIPLATPSEVNYTSGGQKLNLTYAAGTPTGSAFLFNFYDAITGAQIITIDGKNVVNFASTTALQVNLGNGKKFTDDDGSFTVTVNTDPASCESLPSPPFVSCTGTASAVPVLDAVEVGDSAITGNFGGSPPTGATIRVVLNGSSTSFTTTTTGSANTFSIAIPGVTLTTSDTVQLTSINTGTGCINEAVSSSLNPILLSLIPTVNSEGCFDGNATQISGTSAENGGTIRLYSKTGPGVTTSDTQLGTAIVADGKWTVTGLSIPAGDYVAATVENIPNGESVSEISNEVLISSKTTFTTLLIASDPITEGDASINGTSSGLPTGSTIQLYLDGDKAFNSSGNLLTTTTDVSGNWEFLTLDSPLEILYADAIVSVTATSTVAGSCESGQSSSKIVICNPPAVPTITAVSSTPICENGVFTVTILDAQPGLLYQLLDQDNNVIGPSIIGPSSVANKDIDTNPIPFGTTSLKVRASKIFGTCTTVESNAISITVNPSPTITFGPNPSATYNASSQTVDLTYSATSNAPTAPTDYKIDFDDAAFTDIAYTALPPSPIVINVPAALAQGVYTATVTIKETTTPESCEKSYPITITILDPLAPTIALTNSSVDLCAGTTTANFVYSATGNSPNQYSIDFSDAANLQGFTDKVNITLPPTPIAITVPTSPAGGTYTAVIQLLNTTTGNVSQEYPITISIEKTTSGIVAGDQIILSGTDVAAFNSTEDATGLGGVTYQWQKSTTSATAGFSVIGGATAATYDEGTVTVTTYYKRIATSVTNSCTAESNVITVKILALTAIPMITQVYQVGNEKWIEVTNTSDATTIPANEIKVILYKDKSFVFDGKVPDANYTITTPLAAGASVLIKNTLSTTVTNINGTPLVDDDLTNIEGGNDMIALSTATDDTAWENRYDIVASIPNKTSLVRIDETTSTNKTYTESEWVKFIDDAILIYSDVGAAAQDGRHPHAPLISEITGSDSEANTLLGLHRIGSTATSGGAWDNGEPDRSRFVIVNGAYDHGATKLSARKLTVNAKLGIENLLVVTNNIALGASGEIRLIDTSGDSKAQLIQTHTSASLVTGTGKLLVDQNSTVPSKYRYNYMGSPVKNSAGASTYTIASVLKDGTNPTSFLGTIENTASGIGRDISILTGLNYDGSFTASSITLADYWMYTYASSGEGRANWFQTRSGGSIANTNGFIFKGPGRPQNYTFLGVPKDGNVQTSIGADESYLIGNPYPSAISVKEFIEDNISSITGTLYFWKHAGEIASTGINGHYFAGYIGGYATRTIATGVTAKAANLSGETGLVDITLEAESSENTTSGEVEGTAILLNSATDSITFHKIPRSVDSIRIRYKSTASKTIDLKVNDVIKTNITLPSTSGAFSTQIVSFCVFVGSNITISSTNTDTITIDYLNFYDINGEVNCSPTSGDDIFQEPEAFIPIGQGFFVAGDTDGGDIVFDNSQREYVTEGAGSAFFRKSKKSSNITGLPIIKIGMNHKGSNSENLHRQLAVSFNSFQSFDYDKGYDAEMFDVGKTDFYWKFPNNDSKYVIAGVQSISNDLEVPLEITLDYSGYITLMLDEIKNYNGDLYITDKLIGKSYNIKNEKATISLEKGTYSNRFVLTFKPFGALSVLDEIINTYTNIFVDNKNDIINITKNQEINIKKVTLINILGKTISLWDIAESKNEYQLKIKKELPAGVYFVQLNSDKGKINKKIIIE